jgi:NAD(P)-dependent dehydrogenase (short-subunit alcohol dehydrogenase family)
MADTVLITGASRGIGLEFAKQYASDGWRVHACCRTPGNAGELQQISESSNGRVDVHALDVTDAGAIRALASELDGESIDVLINNAGVYGPERQPFGSIDEIEWMHVLRVNTVAPLKVSEAFVEQVARSRRKTIAVVSSLMGSIADNGSGGYYIYRSSKAAANIVAKSMAVDLKARGIVAVVLHPGWVQTDMGGPSATTSPEESVSGMRKVLDGLTPADGGRFYDYTGEALPW